MASLVEVEKLLDCKLYRSAENLGLLIICGLQKANPKPNQSNGSFNELNMTLSQAYALVGDAIMARDEFKRAFYYFTQAVHYIKVSRSNLKARSQWIMNAEDADIVLKTAICHQSLKNNTAALRELESIPTKYRSLQCLMLMSKLYIQSERKADAIAALRSAYAIAPYAVEIAEELAIYRVEETELHRTAELYETRLTSSTNANNLIIAAFPTGWFNTLLHAIYLQSRYESDRAIEALQQLLPHYPKNLYLLHQLAEMMITSQRPEEALSLLKQCQRIDGLYLPIMPRLGELLASQPDQDSFAALQQLATTVLEAQPTFSTGYVVASHYCMAKKELEAAINFADRALSLDSQYTPAFLAKGKALILQETDYAAAHTVFLKANRLSREVGSYVGMVESLLLQNRFRDAAQAAKEMLLTHPRSAQAVYIMGTVLIKSPQGGQEAIKAYTKALKLQPRLVDAAIALCTAHLAQHRPHDAVTCAEQYLSRVPHPKLMYLLGKALAVQEKYHEALLQLQLAVSTFQRALPPGSTGRMEEAYDEIEKIENILRLENKQRQGGDEEEETEDIDEGDEEVDESGEAMDESS